MTEQASVLIIDDDTRLAAMLETFLGRHGFSVTHAPRAEAGLNAAEQSRPDAIVLDLSLPDLDGLEVCRRLRARSDVPIVMLTARGETTDRIVGLELGADDYLPKPFEPHELIARLRAVLRRARPTATGNSHSLRFGPVVIDEEARAVSVDGERRDLTSHQFDILWTLASRAGRVQSRDQLMQAVRGTSPEAYDRSIDVHISRIRAAIEHDPRRPTWIRSVRGVGYVMTKPTSEDGDA